MNWKEKLRAKVAKEREKNREQREREKTAKAIRTEKATVAKHKAQEKYAIKRAEAKEKHKYTQYKERLNQPSGFSMGGSPFGATKGTRANPFGPATYGTGGKPLAKKMVKKKRRKAK